MYTLEMYMMTNMPPAYVGGPHAADMLPRYMIRLLTQYIYIYPQSPLCPSLMPTKSLIMPSLPIVCSIPWDACIPIQKRLWTGVHSWKEMTETWLQTPFTEIDAATLEKNVTTYQKTCYQAVKGLPNNQVAKKLKVRIFMRGSASCHLNP